MTRARRGRGRRSSPAAQAQHDEITMIVCRGGDCGSRTKHPELDHKAQLARLRAELSSDQALVLTSRCLDACEHSNVVVVVPGAAGRGIGATPVWVGEVNDADTTSDLIRWTSSGGPGSADEPALVAIRSFRPSRLSRHELESGEALS